MDFDKVVVNLVYKLIKLSLVIVEVVWYFFSLVFDEQPHQFGVLGIETLLDVLEGNHCFF